MKKLLTILLVLICLLGCVGCDPGTVTIDGDELLGNTVKIELVYYENEDPEHVRLGETDNLIFDFSKVSVIAELDDSRIDDVVEDIAAQELLWFGRTLNEPIGKTIILYQSNGNMVVLYACIYENERGVKKYYGQCNIYDENGKFIDYVGDVASDYIDILESKYFETIT